MMIEQMRKEFDEYFEKELTLIFSENELIKEAALYSAFGKNKRIRPLLTMAAGNLFKVDKRITLVVATAIEMVHTSSLIHDDLPGMDGDDFRRGQESCHKKFGEAVAILAGDSLLIDALRFLLMELSAIGCKLDEVLQLSNDFLKCIGSGGLILGQTLDMTYDPKNVKEPKKYLEMVHFNKTAGLIELSVLLGGNPFKRTKEAKVDQSFKNLARNMGLIFQIVDDVLDITAEFNDLGKTPGKDISQNKLTYPSVYGLESSLKHLSSILDEIMSDLNVLESEVPDSQVSISVFREIMNKIIVKLPKSNSVNKGPIDETTRCAI